MPTNVQPNAAAAFGAFIRERRLSLKLTARDVASNADLQPSNLCNLEHGLILPSQEPNRLKSLAEALRFKRGTGESNDFFDKAAKATGSIPVDIADIISENEAMPIMLRSIGNRRLKKADIARIVALVRGK